VIGPRARLVALGCLFASPIVASVVAYTWIKPAGGGSFGELLLPPAAITAQRFTGADGAPFEFSRLAGKWILVASDSGGCTPACRDKLTTLRQVRLALGRNAMRVERVFVVDDGRKPQAGALEPFAGTVIAIQPAGTVLPPGAGSDRVHIYLVDPRGNVMMRWAARVDPKRMLADLQRLLRASQIG
jgi:cytochrome oxidase Cu insertion factor (SCO1/SenC/PrrC family)